MTQSPTLPQLGRGILAGYLVLSPVVFWYGLIEPFEASKSAFTQLTALALLVLGIAGCSWAEWWPCLKRQFNGPIGLAVALGVLAACLSTLFSNSLRTSLQGAPDSAMGLGSVLAWAVLFGASRTLCREQASAEPLLAATVVGTALSCGYGLVQALGHDPVQWALPWVYSGWLRPAGTQGHPNYLAGHVVMVLPILLWLCVRAGQRRELSAVLGCCVLLLVFLVTVILCFSRGAFLAGGLAILVLGLSCRGAILRFLPVVLVPMVLGLGLLILANHSFRAALLERLSDPFASPGRMPIWEGALALFANHPWTGSGLDTFGIAWPSVRTPEYWAVEWGFMPSKAHNDFLHTLATQGLVGGVAYLMLPVALLVGVLRNRRPLAVVLGCVALAFYAQNLVGFAVASTSGLLAIVAGMIAACENVTESVPESSTLRVIAPATWLGVALVLGTLYLGDGDPKPWRLALLGLTLFWLAKAGLAMISPSQVANVPGISVPWLRPGLASLVALVPSWYLLAPLLGSGLAFRAEQVSAQDLSQGLAFHQWAVHLAPGDARLHELRARATLHAATLEPNFAARQALLQASRSSIESAVRLEPQSPRYQANRARILFALAQDGLADPLDVLRAFDDALVLDRCDWMVVADAARAATTLGFPAETERYLQPALAQQPDLGFLLAERGALEAARGQLALAGETLRQSLAAQWHDQTQRRERAEELLKQICTSQRG